MIRSYALICGLLSLFLTIGLAVTAQAQEEDADNPLVQLVVDLLGEKDKDMRALGLEQIRTEMKGTAATVQIAAQLEKLPPGVQTELISALTDRGDVAARPAIVTLLKSSGEEPVRVAAIRALGFLGEPGDLGLLIAQLSQDSVAEQKAARVSLSRLSGEQVSKAIAKELKQAKPALRITLIETLVARRAFDTATDLLPQAVNGDAAVRAAAMTALAQLGGPDHIAGMVQGILAAERGRLREAAEKAVMLVCRRSEDPDQQAQPLLQAIDQLQAADQIVVLPAVGRVGGAAALKMVKAAVADSDRKVHDAGIRALCNWPDASVAPELVRLVKTDPHAGDQTRALRALIRIAPLPDGRTDLEKLELLKSALPLCARDEERKLVLQRASAIRLPETLRFLMPYVAQPAFAEQACLSIVELAHHRSLREPNQEEFHQALEKVKQTSSNATVIDRATRYQKGETWVRQ